MPTYLVRKKPSPPELKEGTVLLAVADSATELFWLVDEFDDPSSYEYTEAENGFAIAIPYQVDHENGAVPSDADNEEPFSEDLSIALDDEGEEHEWCALADASPFALATRQGTH